MALTIFWTKRASSDFEGIQQYLENEWTEREVKKFTLHTFYFIDQLAIYPRLLPPGPRKNTHRGPINKHTILTYRYWPRKKQIEIISLRGTRQKPSQ
ncbi:MAG: type II toxin-antitoxin system RelE/ParE family toxin [Salibacteraceae bacterium]